MCMTNDSSHSNHMPENSGFLGCDPVSDTKFLGIYLQDSINWNNHIQCIIPKLSSACYIMRRLKPIMPTNTIKIACYSYFNAVMTYGLSFWGNSPHSIKIFKLQKKAVRIITGNNSRASCRNLFKRLCILPLPSQYILSIVLFMVENKHSFALNSEHHNKNTRQCNNSYHPTVNLEMYHTAVHYMGIRVFNSLPTQ